MKLTLRLYGPFMAHWADRTPCGIAGAKQQALLALLATAPEYARTRSWLIARLWSDSDEEKGRRNLRQMLHGLRAALGTRYGDIIGADGDLVYLEGRQVQVLGDPSDGEFLEGFDLCEDGFEDWLLEQRQSAPNPHKVQGLDRPQVTERPLHRIAVLPFVMLDTGGVPGVGDAMAHQLSVAFARSGMVDAISHLSCREMAATTPSPVQADFHLIGRCSDENGKRAVDVTLVQADDGKVLWGERFPINTWADLTGETDLIHQIAGQCLWLIVARSGQLSSVQPLRSAAAHVLMMTGIAEMHSFDRKRFVKARTMLDEVADRCSDNPLPFAWTAQWHLLAAYQGWSTDKAETRQKADDAIARALDLNPYCELSLAIDGNLRNVLDGDFAAAATRFETARTINPSSAMVSQLSAVLYCFTGRGEEAVAMTERTRRLAPRDPRRAFFAGIGASSYLVAGRWTEAVAEAEAALVMNPGHLSAERCRIIGLQSGGREAEAQTAAQDLLARHPAMTVTSYLRTHPAGETPTGQSWAKALRDAGVPMN